MLTALLRLCEPRQWEYLQNLHRYAKSLNPDEYAKFSVGTTSNESLHAELNTAFNHVTTEYQSTLKLKLRIFHISKMMPHLNASNFPMLRTSPRHTRSARVLGSQDNLWPQQEWQDHVRTLPTCDPITDTEGQTNRFYGAPAKDCVEHQMG